MRMFTSFDETAFWKTIEEKDMQRLKINTVSAIRNDPTFAHGEYNEIVSTLSVKLPDIFEEEVTLSYEERLPKEQWDKNYFTKLTYWFQENFALSRIKYIKEVGKVVYKDTVTINTTKQETPSTFHQTPEKDKKNKKTTSPWEIVLAVAALVLVVVLLLKLIK